MDPSVRGQPDGGRSFLAAEMGNETFIDRRMEFIYKEQPQKLYIGRKIFRPRYQAPVAGAPKTTTTRHMDVPDIVSQSVDVNVDVNKNVIASKKGGTIYREIKSEATDNREMRSLQSTNNPEVIMRTKKSMNESDVSMRTAQSAESPEISRRISQSMAPEMSTRTIQSINTPKIQMADRTSRYGAVDVGAQREKTDQEEKNNVFGIETGQRLSMPPPPTVPDLVADTRQVAVDSATRVHSGPQGSVQIVDGGRVGQGGSVGIQNIVDGGRMVQGGSVGIESVNGGRMDQGGPIGVESVYDGGRVVQGDPQGNVHVIDGGRVVQGGSVGVESVIDSGRVVQSGAPRIGSSVLQSGTVGKEQYIDKREETLPVTEPEKVMRRVQTFQVQPLAFSTETSSGQTPSVYDSSVVQNTAQTGSFNLTQEYPSATLSDKHEESPKDEEPAMRTKRTPPKPRPRSSKLHLDASSVPLSPKSTPAQVTVQDGGRAPSPRASDEKTFDLPPPPRGQEYNTLDISHMLVLPKLPPLELSKGRPRSMVVEPSRVEVSDTQVPSTVLAARPVSASYSYNPVSSVRAPSVSDRTEDVTMGRHASTLERKGTGQDRQGFSLERLIVTQERPDMAPTRPDMAPTRPDMAPARQDLAPTRQDMAPTRLDMAPVRPDMAPARPDMAQDKREMELRRQNVALERPDMTQESQAMTLTSQTATQSRPVMAPTGENVSLERTDVTQFQQDVTQARPEVTLERRGITPTNQEVSLERTDVTQFRQDVTQAKPEVTLERQGMTLTNQGVSLERPDVTQFRQDVTQARPEMTQERQAMTLTNQEASLERPDVTQARPDMTLTRNDAALDRADVTVASQDVIQARTETRTNDAIKATEASTERTNIAMARTMEAPVAETVPPVSTTSEVEQAAAERFPIGDKEEEPFVRHGAKIKPMVMTKPFGLRSSGRNAWAPVRYTKVEPNDASSKPIEAATTIVNTPAEIKRTEIESNVVLTKTYGAPPVAAKPLATNQSEKISSEHKGESQMNFPPSRQTVVGVGKTAVDNVVVRVPGVGDGVNTTFVDRTMDTIYVTSGDKVTVGQGTVFSYDGSKPIASVSGYGSVSKVQEIQASRPTTQASETSGLLFDAPEPRKTAMIERPDSMSTAQSHIVKDSETILRTSPQAYLPEPTEDVQIVKSQDPRSLQSTPRDIFFQNIQDVQFDEHRGATTLKADESVTSITKSTDTTRSELQMTYDSAPVVQSFQSVQPVPPVPPVKPAKPQLLTKPVRLSSDLTDVDDNKPTPKPKPKPMLFGAKPFSATPRSVTSVKVPRPGQAWTGYSQQSNTDAKTFSITRDIIGSSRCPSGGQAAAVPGGEDSEYRVTATSTPQSDENRSLEKDTSQTETLTKHMEVTPEAEVKSRTVPVQSVKPFSVESRTLSTVTAPSQQPRQDVTISHMTEDMGLAVGDKTSYMDSNRPATISGQTSNTTSSRQIGGVISPGALDDEVDAVKYEDSIGFRQNIVSHSAGPGVMNTSDVIGSARYPGGQTSVRDGQEGYRSVETNIRGVETTEEVVLRSKPSGSESTAREVTRTSSITGSRPLAFQPRKRSSYVISAAKKKTPEDPALNMSETSVESATRRVSQTSVDSAPEAVRKLSQSSLDSSSDASANLSQSSIEYQQGLLSGGEPKRSSTLVYSTQTTAPSRRVMSGGYAASNVVPAVNVNSSGVGQGKQVDQITDRYTAGDPQNIQSSRTTHMIYSSGPSVSTTAYNTSTHGGESGLRLTGPETRAVPMSARDIIGSARYPGGRRSPRDEDQGYTSVETSVSNVDMNTRTVETTDDTVLRNPSAQATSTQREVTRTSSITSSRPPSFQARKRSSYVISAAKKKSVTDDSPPSVAPKPVSTPVSESHTITSGLGVSTETSSLVQGSHSATVWSERSANENYYSERPITGESFSSRSIKEHSMNSYNEQSIDRKMDTVDAASPQSLQVRGDMSYVPYPAGEEGDRLSVIVTDL